MPFHSKTPITYLFAWILEVVMCFCYCITPATILLSYFGFCSFFVDFTVDLTHDLHYLGRKTRISVDRIGKLKPAAHTEIKKDFYEYIRFHIEAKQLSGMKSMIGI